MFGIPIEYNDTPLRNRPLVTWSLAAVIAVASLAAMTDLKAAVGVLFWWWTHHTLAMPAVPTML